MKKGLFLYFVLVCVGGISAQEQSFSLKNSEDSCIFYFWRLNGSSALQSKELIQEIPKAIAGRESVGPLETRPVVLGKGEFIAGVFVPWKDSLNFRSVVSGGFLLGTEAPQGKTVLLSRENFLAFNGKRKFEAALQDLNIGVPQFELDGDFQEWAKVLPMAEFGATFAPKASKVVDDSSSSNGQFPTEAAPPKMVQLQGALSDDALWFHIKIDKPIAFGKAGFLEWSLNLRFYENRTAIPKVLEIPVTAEHTTTWFWENPTAIAQPVGQAVIHDQDLEIWIPLNRFTSGMRASLLKSSVDFSQVLELNGKTWDLYYTSYKLQEFP